MMIGAEQNLIGRVFSAELLRCIADAHRGHFKDPLVQLAHAQLWVTFISIHTATFKALQGDRITDLAAIFTASIKALMRVHLVQWKYLSCLMHLFRVNSTAATHGLLREDGAIVLQYCFVEGAADGVLLQQLLKTTLTFAYEFRFLSAITRDDAELPLIIQKALDLQEDEPSIQNLGNQLLVKLNRTPHG